jgi:hypothetical protein
MSGEPGGSNPAAGAERANAPTSAQAVSAGPARAGGVDVVLVSGRAIGAGIGYGCLAVFLYLISVQVYRWFRDGEWTHFGISEAVRAGLVRCCVKGDDTGRLAALVHWIDTPTDWLGLHQVLESVPASLALFALSILGNSILVYCHDRIDERRRLVTAEPAESREHA